VFGAKGGGTLAAQIVLNLARGSPDYAFEGYLNDRLDKGVALLGGKVLCRFDDWRLLDPAIRFVAPLHKSGAIQANMARITALDIPASRWATLVDPAATICDETKTGRGSVVAPQAVLYPNATLGDHVFVRPGAVIGNDVTIGDFSYVGPNAVVGGASRVGTGVHVGPGAIVRDELTIGQFAVIGFGAVVTKDVPAYAVVVGNPARIQGQVERHDA
jgi:sugar O-acyltransferase (sialic acid O-acetyltransferase NeuD family)